MRDYAIPAAMSEPPASYNKASFSRAAVHTDESGAEPTAEAMDILAPDHFERNRGYYLQIAKQVAGRIIAMRAPKPGDLSLQSKEGAVVGTSNSRQKQAVKEPPPKTPLSKRVVKVQPSKMARPKRVVKGRPSKTARPEQDVKGRPSKTAHPKQDLKERPSKTARPKQDVKGQPQRGRGRDRCSPRRPVAAATVSVTEQPPIESQIQKPWFPCHLCCKTFSSMRSLKSHLEEHMNFTGPWRRSHAAMASTSMGSSSDAPPTDVAPVAGLSVVTPPMLKAKEVGPEFGPASWKAPPSFALGSRQMSAIYLD